MMDFRPNQPRRSMAEPIVPMINIVFLLLIFFMMTAVLAPPDPIEVTPPEAEAPANELPSDTLFVGPDGALAYQGLRGAAAIEAAARHGQDAELSLRADARLPAADLAGLLVDLARRGVSEIGLVTVAP